MKTIIACILLQVFIYLPLQAQSFGYTVTSVNDTSMTFVPMLDIMMTNDTAWLAYTIYETISEDSIYVSEQFLYTDMTWSTPVTVFGLNPSTEYSIYLEMWGTNWNFMDGVYGATPGSFTTTGPMSLGDVQTVQFLSYPNPVSTTLTIQGSIENEQLKVFDLTGKMILLKQANHSQIDVDVSGFPAGTYILSIGNRNKKILVYH